jgi:NADPH-dependent 2,4-dienoyl-CoA reductase/sulfur reductase-like enzyme
VTLADGSQLAADIVIAGTGVRPRIELAERAGLEIDGGGVQVDEYLETSVPGVYAAGDIACWPDALTGEPVRAEHWVVAQRQGQVAARNLLGYRERYTTPPFFWSQHYDVSLNCVGHAEQWDDIRIDGDPEKQDCDVSYCVNGRTLALVTIFRDRQSLEMEASLQRQAVS